MVVQGEPSEESKSHGAVVAAEPPKRSWQRLDDELDWGLEVEHHPGQEQLRKAEGAGELLQLRIVAVVRLSSVEHLFM